MTMLIIPVNLKYFRAFFEEKISYWIPFDMYGYLDIQSNYLFKTRQEKNICI